MKQKPSKKSGMSETGKTAKSLKKKSNKTAWIVVGIAVVIVVIFLLTL